MRHRNPTAGHHGRVVKRKSKHHDKPSRNRLNSSDSSLGTSQFGKEFFKTDGGDSFFAFESSSSDSVIAARRELDDGAETCSTSTWLVDSDDQQQDDVMGSQRSLLKLRSDENIKDSVLPPGKPTGTPNDIHSPSGGLILSDEGIQCCGRLICGPVILQYLSLFVLLLIFLGILYSGILLTVYLTSASFTILDSSDPRQLLSYSEDGDNKTFIWLNRTTQQLVIDFTVPMNVWLPATGRERVSHNGLHVSYESLLYSQDAAFHSPLIPPHARRPLILANKLLTYSNFQMFRNELLTLFSEANHTGVADVPFMTPTPDITVVSDLHDPPSPWLAFPRHSQAKTNSQPPAYLPQVTLSSATYQVTTTRSVSSKSIKDKFFDFISFNRWRPIRLNPSLPIVCRKPKATFDLYASVSQDELARIMIERIRVGLGFESYLRQTIIEFCRTPSKLCESLPIGNLTSNHTRQQHRHTGWAALNQGRARKLLASSGVRCTDGLRRENVLYPGILLKSDEIGVIGSVYETVKFNFSDTELEYDDPLLSNSISPGFTTLGTLGLHQTMTYIDPDDPIIQVMSHCFIKNAVIQAIRSDCAAFSGMLLQVVFEKVRTAIGFSLMSGVDMTFSVLLPCESSDL